LRLHQGKKSFNELNREYNAEKQRKQNQEDDDDLQRQIELGNAYPLPEFMEDIHVQKKPPKQDLAWEVANLLEMEAADILERDMIDEEYAERELQHQTGKIVKRSADIVQQYGNDLQALDDKQLDRNKNAKDLCQSDAKRLFYLSAKELKGLSFRPVTNPHGAHYPPMKLFSSHLCRLLSDFKWTGMVEEAKQIRNQRQDNRR